MRRRLTRVRRRVVDLQQHADGVIVAYHETSESELAAQKISQQPAVGDRRDAVDLVVRIHDEAQPGLPDGPGEWHGVDVDQLATPHGRTGLIETAFRRSVAREMFGSGEYRVRLGMDAAHIGDAVAGH